MRIAISSSCLTVIILLLVMIHCSIINKNYRDIEVNGSINDAFLYAADKAYSSYIDYNESDNNMTDDDIINNTMQVFNNAFNNSVSSAGSVGSSHWKDSNFKTSSRLFAAHIFSSDRISSFSRA